MTARRWRVQTFRVQTCTNFIVLIYSLSIIMYTIYLTWNEAVNSGKEKLSRIPHLSCLWLNFWIENCRLRSLTRCVQTALLYLRGDRVGEAVSGVLRGINAIICVKLFTISNMVLWIIWIKLFLFQFGACC